MRQSLLADTLPIIGELVLRRHDRKLTGLRVTAHQFRHAAAAIILQRHPGNYELVRLMLGHRSTQTTMRCYIGLKEVQVSQIFGELIRERLTIDLDAAE